MTQNNFFLIILYKSINEAMIGKSRYIKPAERGLHRLKGALGRYIEVRPLAPMAKVVTIGGNAVIVLSLKEWNRVICRLLRGDFIFNNEINIHSLKI